MKVQIRESCQIASTDHLICTDINSNHNQKKRLYQKQEIEPITIAM
jgi:hypothetical protein